MRIVSRVILSIIILIIIILPTYVLWNDREYKRQLENENLKTNQEIKKKLEELNNKIENNGTKLEEFKQKLDDSIIKQEDDRKDINKLLEIEKNILARKSVRTSRGGVEREYRVTPMTLQKSESLDMRATAYDLTTESCGKKPSHPEYGITRSGMRVKYRTTVAVDPNVIPLGTVLYIQFPSPYEYLNGIYVAMDTGSAVKNDIIDIYMGESKHSFCDMFGIRKVKVFIIG